jgi:hypothetical protein
MKDQGGECMKQHWNEQELVEHWTLTDSDKQLLDQRTERGRLGLAVLLKFFQAEGRFPLHHKEVPLLAVNFLAEQRGIPVTAWFDFPLKGRSSERGRARIRAFLGFRPATTADGEQIQEWLCRDIVPQDQEPRHLRAAVLDWCQEHRIEPPTNDRIDRLIGAAVHTFENAFFVDIQKQLSPITRQRLDALLTTASLDQSDGDWELSADISPFSHLKADPGRISLASVLKEIAKLKRIAEVQLPGDLFTDVPQKILERYRLRVATESVPELHRHPEPIRHTLTAAFCWQQRKAIIDGLVELLIQIVHRVSVRAERRVITEIVGGLEKVHGKTMLLFRLAEAAVEQPDGVIRDVLFPVVGEPTLQALVKAFKRPDLSASRPHAAAQFLQPSLPSNVAADPRYSDVSFQQRRASAGHRSASLAQSPPRQSTAIYRL